ncbi:hypothetical protein [Candidatus Kuenenia sp.]|uniref:hypothetical protein n=1 Tax=Candidatus Kuenenia sp. TaxID=2499824 RepID=UPI00322014CD
MHVIKNGLANLWGNGTKSVTSQLIEKLSKNTICQLYAFYDSGFTGKMKVPSLGLSWLGKKSPQMTVVL